MPHMVLIFTNNFIETEAQKRLSNSTLAPQLVSPKAGLSSTADRLSDTMQLHNYIANCHYYGNPMVKNQNLRLSLIDVFNYMF